MYRIITGILTVVILVAVIIWYAVPKTKALGTSGSPFDEVTVLEDARQIARLMGNQDYDTILNTWGNDTLRKALDDEKLKEAYMDWCEELGLSPKTGYVDYIEEILESENSVWDSLSEFGEDDG